ncbi:MAG: tetratricopeptide repeat protein [Bacteroidales bacterium]|nr:tetratricopeptide repeat protein [Bacteroidales bacterium]MCF8337350.1 tetratricopeptide repeat protein [Bacteroidales bacterium]
MRKKSGIKGVLLVLGLVSVIAGSAQNPNKHVREGNELYEKKKFKEAETNYLKALKTDSTAINALFNRADALYQQEKYKEAGKIFDELTTKPLSGKDEASVWHNLGNTMVKSKNYKNAIEAYKKALKKQPSDMDTKYNLSYAMEKLKQQQKKQQNKNKNQQDKKDKQDKQKSKQKQDSKKDKQQQQNKQKQQQDQQKQKQKQNRDKQKQAKKKDQSKKQKQQKARKISKEDAKRMLEALKNNEKVLMKKLKRKKKKGQEVETEKDW